MSSKRFNREAFTIQVVYRLKRFLLGRSQTMKHGLKDLAIQQCLGQSWRDDHIEGDVYFNTFSGEKQLADKHIRWPQVEQLERPESGRILFYWQSEQEQLSLLGNTNLLHTFLPFPLTTCVLGGSQVVGNLSLRDAA